MRSSTKGRATTDRVRAKCFYPLSLSLSLSPCVKQRSFQSLAFRCSFLRSTRRNIREEKNFEFSSFVSNWSPRVYIYIYMYTHEYILIINPVVGLRARCGFTSIYVTLALRAATLFPGLLIIIKFRFHTRAGETKDSTDYISSKRDVTLLRGADTGVVRESTWNWLKFR